jgi:serine/threonine protein kinase/tetratricopeptide (TPR) repeat protein
VPPRTMPTGPVEVNRVRKALADRYRIERILGEGGMATVYLAMDLKHQRKVAVKVMRPELAEGLGAERFLREVGIAARLSHPHILPVHDSGSSDGILYYVMPLVEGESLPARLKRERQLPVEEALRLAREVAEALAYAHRQGIIHRDIKPANILISEGHALVADFGIARATSDDGATLTGTGLAIGTPQYMSPEQASGEPNIDGRTDIYALGCVLYEMIAGEPPFTGPTAQAVISRSITEDPRPLTRTRPSLPPQVDAITMKALAKSPADRYQTAADFAAALSTAATATTAVSGSVSRTPFKPWMAIAAALLVVALGATSIKLFGGPDVTTARTVRSVVVLPFQNQGADDEAYFVDGIADEVRTRLARLDRFTVISSASADEYRGSDKKVTDIARELRVDQVLSGTVRWATGADGVRRFRVNVELVDGSNGEVTWRDSFDGDLSDPFAVQGQIATRVAGALGTVLAAKQVQDLAGRPTTSAEAYDEYLKGKAIRKSSANTSRLAATNFERAVALDSMFAQAWAELAISTTMAFANGTRDPSLARRARFALDKAFALAPDSAFTHVAASYFTVGIDGDEVAALRHADRALELEPKNLEALTRSASFAINIGDFQKTFDRLKLARDINPRSLRVLAALVRAQIYLGRTAEAVETAEELIALRPDDPSDIQWGAMAYVANGDLPGARRVIERALEWMPETDLVAYMAGYHEMAFVLSPSQLELLYRLTPAAFDHDVAWWGQALAIAAWQQGDLERARAFADSSIEVAFAQIRASEDDSQLRILNAGSLAILGRRAEAIREAEQSLADTVGRGSDDISYVLQQYVRTMITLDEKELALDALEELVERRQFLTQPGWLRTDPAYRPLDGNPRFERLANRGIGRPRD